MMSNLRWFGFIRFQLGGRAVSQGNKWLIGEVASLLQNKNIIRPALGNFLHGCVFLIKIKEASWEKFQNNLGF